MTSEKRTLEIQARMKDFVSKRSKSMGQAISRFSKLSKTSLERVKNTVFNVKTAFVGLAFALTAGAGNAISNNIDELGRWADKLDVNVERLSELQFAASQMGLGGDILVEGLKTIQERMDDASQGAATYREHFDRLGLSVVDADGNLRNVVEFLPDMTQAVKAAAERGQDLTLFFEDVVGGSENMLEILFQRGPEALQKFAAEAQRLGIVIDEEMVAKNRRFQQTLDKLEQVLGSVGRELVTAFAPALSVAAERLAEFVAENRDSLVNALTNLARFAVDAVEIVAKAVIRLGREIQKVLTLAKALEPIALQILGIDLIPSMDVDFDNLEMRTERWFDLLRHRAREFANNTDLAAAVAAPAATFVGPLPPSAWPDEVSPNLDEIERSLLSLLEPTREVELALSRLDEKAASMQLADSLKVAGLQGEQLQAVMASAANVISERFRQTRQEINETFDVAERLEDLDAAIQAAERGRSYRGLAGGSGPLTRREQSEQASEDAALEARMLERDFAAGAISADEFANASKRLQENLDLTLRRLDGDFFLGFTEQAELALDAWADFTIVGAQSAQTLIDTGLGGITSGLSSVIQGTKSAEEAAKQWGASMLATLADVIAELAVVAALNLVLPGSGTAAGGLSAALGFAKGGIMPGSMRGNPLPVKTYASGGIATSPQLAVFGEGPSKAEAFVPLPDGRTIPVTLMGGGGQFGGDMHMHFHTPDAKSARELLWRERHTIMAAMRHGLSRDNPTRQSVQKVRG